MTFLIRLLAFAIFIISLLLLSSCSHSPNDKELRKIRIDSLETAREREILVEVNKDFKYILNSTTFKNNISRDTVSYVLKEYYLQYEGYKYNEATQKLQNIAESNSIEEDLHELDFIKRIINKFNLNEKTAYLVLNDIRYLINQKTVQEQIYDIDYKIDDINYLLEDIQGKSQN